MNVIIENVGETTEAVNIKNLIITHLDDIERKKEELKEAREMLTDVYGNDTEHRDAKKGEGDNRKKRLAIEEGLKNDNPGVADKVDELREELKELKDALSDYLGEFVRITGKVEISKPDGTQYKIVKRFKAISPGQQKLDL